jgi:hypothetical protein
MAFSSQFGLFVFTISIGLLLVMAPHFGSGNCNKLAIVSALKRDIWGRKICEFKYYTNG